MSESEYFADRNKTDNVDEVGRCLHTNVKDPFLSFLYSHYLEITGKVLNVCVVLTESHRFKRSLSKSVLGGRRAWRYRYAIK